jgi:hypothetical protein
VTIGANPSREEFLSENKFKALERIYKNEPLRYLSGPEIRFKTLNAVQDWNHILHDVKLRDEIIDSYNQYFNRNPYKWFGKRAAGADLAYNVEGFINGLEASFFEGNQKYQGIHIDLMPFPTIQDFKDIMSETEKHIFRNNWAKRFLEKLIGEMSPRMMLVFGKTNLQYLQRFLEIPDIGKMHHFSAVTENGQTSKADYWSFRYKHLPVIGLSVNLGNPIGFSKKTLLEFGEAVKRNSILGA